MTVRDWYDEGQEALRAAEETPRVVLGRPVAPGPLCPVCGALADLDDPMGVECWAQVRLAGMDEPSRSPSMVARPTAETDESS